MSTIMRRACTITRCQNRVQNHNFVRSFSYQPNNQSVNQSVNQTSQTFDNEQTHFGFSSIPASEKVRAVAGVFDRVASRYDLMNDLMSAGVHRLWKHQLVQVLNPQPGMQLIDVAGGTGDIAFRYIEEMQRRHGRNVNGSVSICDINPNMLQVGENRAVAAGYMNQSIAVDFVEGNAECLPFADESFDAYTIAFGLRNVTHIDAALRDAHRVLKKGGHLMVMEFSTLPNPIFNKFYDMYSFNVIPMLGQIAANDRDSYQYLVESIRKFPVADELLEKLNAAGFKHTRYERLSQGITCIHEGFKL